jgi:hypothetical protein
VTGHGLEWKLTDVGYFFITAPEDARWRDAAQETWRAAQSKKKL